MIFASRVKVVGSPCFIEDISNFIYAFLPAFMLNGRLFSNSFSSFDTYLFLMTASLLSFYFRYIYSLFPILGLLQIKKLPRINCLTGPEIDTSDLAFKLKRKKFSIEVGFVFTLLIISLSAPCVLVSCSCLCLSAELEIRMFQDVCKFELTFSAC